MTDENTITETGVKEIEISHHRRWSNKVYVPAGGVVTWFRDEFGRVWFKFDDCPEGHHEAGYDHHVFPEAACVRVTYRKGVGV